MAYDSVKAGCRAQATCCLCNLQGAVVTAFRWCKTEFDSVQSGLDSGGFMRVWVGWHMGIQCCSCLPMVWHMRWPACHACHGRSTSGVVPAVLHNGFLQQGRSVGEGVELASGHERQVVHGATDSRQAGSSWGQEGATLQEISWNPTVVLLVSSFPQPLPGACARPAHNNASEATCKLWQNAMGCMIRLRLCTRDAEQWGGRKARPAVLAPALKGRPDGASQRQASAG